MSNANPPVFVLSPLHCMASSLTAALERHPGLFVAPNLHWFMADTVAELEPWYARNPRLRDGLVHAVARTESKLEINKTSDMTTREVFAQLLRGAAPRTVVTSSYLHVTPRALAAIRRGLANENGKSSSAVSRAESSCCPARETCEDASYTRASCSAMCSARMRRPPGWFFAKRISTS